MEEYLIEAETYMVARAKSRAHFHDLVKTSGSLEAARDILRSSRKIRNAREQANRIGLAYWPALIRDGNQPSVDPRAYVAAEKVLEPSHGFYQGNPNQSRGGWDSKGYHGLSREQVAKMWFSSGCKCTTKFAVQIRTGIIAKKGDSTRFLLNYVRGKRWLEARKAYEICQSYRPGKMNLDNFILSRKTVATLGRLSIPLRWAAIRDLHQTEEEKVTRPRDLNWAEVARVQSLPKWRRAEGLPTRTQWRVIRGQDAPDGLKDLSPIGAKVAPFEGICNVAEIDPWGETQGEIRRPAWMLATLFGSVNEAKRFVTQTGRDWDANGIHDAGQFTLLQNGKWNVKEWRRMAFKHPEVLRYAPSWGIIEAKAGGVPGTLREVREMAVTLSYEGVETLEDLKVAEAAAKVGVSPVNFHAYRDLVRQGAKTWEEIPHVHVTGMDAGVDGDWVFRTLASDDPMGPMLGLATDCCQHLDGAGADCARHGWSSPKGAFAVVEYRTKVVAQSWLWRADRTEDGTEDGVRGTVVFDSIEALGSAYVEGIAALYKVAAKALIGRLGVCAVRVGDTNYGITWEVSKLLDGDLCKTHVAPEDYRGYMDGSRQRAIPGVPA